MTGRIRFSRDGVECEALIKDGEFTESVPFPERGKLATIGPVELFFKLCDFKFLAFSGYVFQGPFKVEVQDQAHSEMWRTFPRCHAISYDHRPDVKTWTLRGVVE